MTLRRRPPTGATLITVALRFGITACGSANGETGRHNPAMTVDTPMTTLGGFASATRHLSAVKFNPCAAQSAELVTGLVRFPVEGDGTATDDGNGLVSCRFTAPLDADGPQYRPRAARHQGGHPGRRDPQPSRSMIVTLACPPPSHIVWSP